jgi:ATP-dependent Zn protease
MASHDVASIVHQSLVAGVDEAKAELVELVEMLRSADKYKAGVSLRTSTRPTSDLLPLLRANV